MDHPKSVLPDFGRFKYASRVNPTCVVKPGGDAKFTARSPNGTAPSFKRCRIAIQKRTMTDKSPKTKAELEALVLAELRAASDCGGAVHVTVVAFDDYRVGATWEVASCNAGTSAPEACERALCDIIRRLQQHFDIASS